MNTDFYDRSIKCYREKDWIDEEGKDNSKDGFANIKAVTIRKQLPNS